ncbi:DUF6463 family protein [Pseudoalteromonas sp. PPB1]|uniref:DUF6463 family protein n=1 Tax=Pseudoalteromonas sp. PPB1 TaxID=2756136 RepID=UPI0018910498|nr:DUF6463 family protein [Pseudoalteromonas sp. PPB1]
MKPSYFMSYGLIAIGLLHNLVGLLMGWEVLTAMHQDGWFASTIKQDMMLFDREAIVWFLVCGSLFILLGCVLKHMQKHDVPLPGLLCPALFTLGLIIVIIMPLSGGYLLILLALVPSITRLRYRKSSHL